MGWLGWIIVGAIAGWASGYALKRDTKFDVAELVVAFVGAILVTIVWEKYLR